MSVIISGSTTISGSTDLGYKMNTDGLLLYLDAGNVNSYLNTGSIWYDISSNENDSIIPPATEYRSVSSSFYTNGNLGSFVRFDVPQIKSSTNVITVELVYKCHQYNPQPIPAAYNLIFGFNYYNLMITTTNNELAYNTGHGDFMTTTGLNFQVEQWKHLVCEMYQYPPTIDTGNNKLWINGVQQALSGGSVDGLDQDFNFGNGRIAGAFGWNFNYNSIGYYPIFKIYNRVLSQDEITNNYNYYKIRYPFS